MKTEPQVIENPVTEPPVDYTEQLKKIETKLSEIQTSLQDSETLENEFRGKILDYIDLEMVPNELPETDNEMLSELQKISQNTLAPEDFINVQEVSFLCGYGFSFSGCRSFAYLRVLSYFEAYLLVV